MDIASISSALPPARDVPAFGTSAANAGPATGVGNEVSMSGVTGVPSGKPSDTTTKALDMQTALNQANQMLQQTSTSLEFQVDPASKQTVVKMVDITNNQVLKQFPSEEFLRMASVVDTLQKQLVNEKV